MREGCLAGKPAIDMPLECTPRLVERADVAPDMRVTLPDQWVA